MALARLLPEECVAGRNGMKKHDSPSRRRSGCEERATHVARRFLAVLVLAAHIRSCSTWFHSGELTWKRVDTYTVNFELRTAWERTGYPTTLTRMTVGEDITTINAAWQAMIAKGPGGLLNISEGISRDSRRAIVVCEPRTAPGCTLQANSSRFNFIITRLDPDLVYASLKFSHTYSQLGVYTAYFEGCCRSRRLYNNAHLSFHLRSSVAITTVDSTWTAPRLALPAVLQLQQAGHYLIEAIQERGLSQVAYRLGNADEMGFAMDRPLGLPWGVAAPGPYVEPDGVKISSGGLLSLAAAATPACAGGCLLQVTLIAASGNASVAVDLVLEVTTSAAPQAGEEGLLVTPYTRPSSPAVILCNSSDFRPPENTSYKVSECILLDEMHKFQCGSNVGICPTRDYAFEYPFNSPLFSNCFRSEGCADGMHRVFCTEVTQQGFSTDFLRIVFRPVPGKTIRFIRQVNDFPSGVDVLGECGQRLWNGTCEGSNIWAGTTDPNTFIDVTWRPRCTNPSEMGLTGLCFVAEGSDGVRSLPSCTYIRVVESGLLNAVPLLGYEKIVEPSFYPFTYASQSAPPAPPDIWDMVIYRQPSHIIAGEPFIVQPQVAFLDNTGSVLTGLTIYGGKVEISVSPYGLHPEVQVLGNRMTHIEKGIAAFTDLVIPTEGTGFMLRIRALSLSQRFEIDTPRFSVLPAARTLKIANFPMPESGVVAGDDIHDVGIFLMDIEGNYAALSRKLVSASLKTVSTIIPGLRPVLHGLSTVQSVNGRGIFDDLKITIAGEYRLNFALGSFNVDSSVFSVSAGKAAVVFVHRQPCAVPCSNSGKVAQVANDFFETSISLRDSYFNLIFFGDGVTYPNASVVLRRFPTKPNVATLLTGTLSVKSSPQHEGVLGYTFTDLSVIEQGFFSLIFQVRTHFDLLISNSTIVFDVQLPVTFLNLVVPPNTSIAGSFVQGPPTFSLLDAYRFGTNSQRASWSELNISAAVFSCAAQCLNAIACFNSAVPYNNTCRQDAVIISGAQIIPSSGLATFPNIVVNRAGVNYRLTVYSSSSISIVTPSFEVEHSQPHELVVARLPLYTIISEPFGVQPVVALVDRFGNVCLKESVRFVEAVLISSSGFFLTGVPLIRLRRGLSNFHNLAIDAISLVRNVSRHALRFKCNAIADGVEKSFQVSSADFDVAPGVLNLTVGVQPSTSVAGEAMEGPPSVLLRGSSGSILTLSNRTMSARIVEADCSTRYPVPDDVKPRVVQAEMRGAVPIVTGQAFVVTNFRAVGFVAEGNVTRRALVKVVDAAFDCDGNQNEAGGLLGAGPQPLICYDDGSCVSESAPDALFLSFNLTAVPASGRVRVCAKAEGERFAVVVVSLQQLGTWKLLSSMPLVKRIIPTRLVANRSEPIDQVTLWWPGPDFDSCNAFRTSASDSRVAFVLSRDVVWNASMRYSCPRHPKTGQIFRWASSEEVLALGTLFTSKADASQVYANHCGSSLSDVLPSKQAFLFSDFARVGVYAKASQRENQSLASGTPNENNVAGLVCVSDEVFLKCTANCHNAVYNDECPVPDVQAGQVEENLPVMIRWTQQPENINSTRKGQRQLLSSTMLVVSPAITSDIQSESNGNTVLLASGTITFQLSLQREPASWVVIIPNQSPHPEFVRWHAGAKMSNNTWNDGARYVFGSKGAGWDYSRHESRQAFAWDSFLSHNITCGHTCSEWPMDKAVELIYTMYSSVPSYNGKKVVITLRKAPDTASMAAALMRSSAMIYSPGPLQTPLPPPPKVEETPVPGPTQDFCIRSGANWRIGGDLPGIEMCKTTPPVAYPCGITWCGKKIKQIDAGAYHTCSIDQDDKVMCWGRNQSGQSGPSWKAQNSTVKSLDAGTYHTCAVLGDDSVTCWGDPMGGKLNVPDQVRSWKAVSCGTAHSCGIDNTGVGYCWGDSTYRQSTIPGDATNLASISAGFFHTCAVGVSGLGYCWGALQYDFKQTVLPSAGPWQQISAGNLHTCGVLVNGTALCWGSNDAGQTNVPKVGQGLSWVHISAGLRHSCGVTSDGYMWCWGSSALNRLLVKPRAGGPWMQVSSGYEHSCGVLRSGRIACWGDPRYGQLAVSAAHFVSFDPPCSSSPSDLAGYLKCVRSGAVYNTTVDVSMSALMTRSQIYYTVANTTLNALVTSALPYATPIRFDVSARVSAEARSLDDEVTDSDTSGVDYVVQVGVPSLTVAAPDVLGAAHYFTSVEVLLAGDASMNPYSNTTIYYKTRTDAESWTQYSRTTGLVLGNRTADLTSGITPLSVIAKRDGARDSTIVSLNFKTKVAPIVFSFGNLSAWVVDTRGFELRLNTSTPDVEIYYTTCPPSTCEVPSDPWTNITGALVFENQTRYSEPITVNETGTIVRAIGVKGGLESSFLSEMTYKLQLAPPVFMPPPGSSTGFLAPVILKITCGLGGQPMYSLNGSAPYLIYSNSSSLILERNLTVRAICVRWIREGAGLGPRLLDSVEASGLYRISLLEILDSPVSESSKLVAADNRITVAVRTTLAITRGTVITITGLVGSNTEDDASMQLSHPGLQATWTKLTGTLVVNVTAPTTSAGRVFAVTDSQRCAEALPLTALDFATCDPRSTCYPQLSTRDFDVVHSGWEQEFFVSGEHKMTIKYEFRERCTLRDRLTGSSDTGNTDCDIVRWSVEYYGSLATATPPPIMSGYYRFSQFSRANGEFASTDDGAWGAVADAVVMSNGPRPQNFWGQGVFDSADAQPGQCDSLYIGNSDNPIRSNAIRSVLKMTRADSALVFSFVLKNPQHIQAPVTPKIVVRGSYCDALGCATQQIGPRPMVGAVLGPSLAFGLQDVQVRQTSSVPGASSIVSLFLKTNLQLSPEYCLPACKILVSLPGSPAALPVQVGGSSVPETTSVAFECNGYRSCQTTVRDYLPLDAVFVSADLDVYIGCSDFNGAGEMIETLMVGGANLDIDSFRRGPWDGCVASCNKQEEVLRRYNVTKFGGGTIPIYLTASQGVDSYSCSQSSTQYVRARVVVNVRYYFVGSHLPERMGGSFAYTLRSTNLDPGCVDAGASSLNDPGVQALDWQDAGGYSCNDYAAFQWCDSATGRCGGDMWTCNDLAVNSVSAKDACCVCGGGQRWWTRVSFALSNSLPARARAPHVTIERADGFVLLNQTLTGFPVGSRDTPASAASRSASSEMAPSTMSAMRRRLLMTENQCMTKAAFWLAWLPEDSDLYTCCWPELERQVAKAVAETVLANLANVNVTLASKSQSEATFAISVIADTDEACIGIANNLRPWLVARALSTQRLRVNASFLPDGSPRALTSSGSSLPSTTVIQVGYNELGAWYEANFAGFRNVTEVGYVQQWRTSEVLGRNQSVASLAGEAIFDTVVVNKACSNYRLKIFTLISDTLLEVTSNAFTVRSGTAVKLYVSPVPTIVASNARWPCWTIQSCPPDAVVAGIYFAVTATAVDVHNNTCLDADGAVQIAVEGRNKTMVYGNYGNQSKLSRGSQILMLMITEAFHDAANPARLTYTYIPQQLAALSQFFAVNAAPLAALVMGDTKALDAAIYAGDVFTPSMQLLLRDAYGNVVLEYLKVEVNLLNAPAVLMGEKNSTAQLGTVFFSRLFVERAGTNYTLVFFCDGIVNVSRSFDVLHAQVGSPGDGSILAIERAPADSIAGEAFVVQPQIRLQDRYGNTAIRNGNRVAVSSSSLAGTTATQLVKGIATFTNVILMRLGPATLTFKLSGGDVSVNASIAVGPSLAKLRVLQQPLTNEVRVCARPYPTVELLSADDKPVNNSRKDVKVDFAVNVFRVVNEMSCSSGGCSASTTFRYFVPGDVTLVSAYLNVDVVKTDYDEDSEYVEYIRINGIAWPGQGNTTDGTCHPNGADMCFSYHKCMDRYDVLQVAKENAMTVTVKVSNAVNDYCAPRLQARVSLYGSYRPKVPETATMVQNGKPLPLAGITTLKANGRTLVFKDLQFPVAGNGYRLRFSTDAGMVSTETEPFDVLERASKGMYIRQPGEAMAGEPLLRQPVVEYRDQFEGLVTTYAPWVKISIGIAQNWDQTLADGFGGYRNLLGADKPVLYGLLEAQGQGGIVQFVNVTIDRPVERLSLTTRACLKGPTGLPEGDCVVTESAAFAVLPSVSSLALANNSMPGKVKAGRMVSANVLLYNAGLLSGAATGGAVLSFSTSTVELSAVSSASGASKITSRGKLVVSAAKGVAQFSEFYLDTVGVSAVTFQAKSRISGVVLASVLRNIVVEAGDAAAIAVLNKSLALNDGIEYAHLWAGKPFFVQLEIQDRFGNRNFSPNLSPVVRASQSSQVKLFAAQIGGTGNTATTSSASDLIQNKTVDGVVTFYLRLDAAKEVRLIFEVALSPAQDCAPNDIADASPASCPGDSRGLQYCEQADTVLGASACMALPLCAFNPVERRCAYACACAGGVRERWCAACVANTSLSVKTYALASSGKIQLTMQRQPAQAVDGMVMKVQPRVLVEVCINAQCNPLASQTVYVSLKSARDETTLGGQSFLTTLMCPAGQASGNCSATSDFYGIVSFYGIGLDSPGSDGASNVLLEFSRYPVAPILAEAFKLDAQENLAPVLVAPSPVLCEDDETPIVYYAVVGSRLHIVMSAADSNTAPYDRLTMEVACEAETLPGVSDCNKVMPVSAYLSENIYSWSSIVSKKYNPACHQVIHREPKDRQIRQKDKVERHFVWSPVSWFPTLTLRYKSVEGLSGYDGRSQLSTCERTVQVVVCDRPRFVAPSPLGVEGHLMTLANTDIVFTVAALDRNQDDVVEIVTDQMLDASAVQLGPNVYDEKLLVTGLEITSRNRVSRLVRWSVPNDGISHKLCFRARDNQFPCGDGGGLVSEDTLCVHCALEPLGVYTTCSSTLTAENLDLRLAPIICGDGRMTDTEQCDDDNSLSGDGCSSLCTLEPGWHQLDPEPRPKYTCGDGLVVTGESCDDNNTRDSDGCSDTCQTEFGFTCLECGGYTECLPTCGDSILASNFLRNETCDNVAGCSSQCSIETGWMAPTVGVNFLVPICGDGRVLGGEECDDGNSNLRDGCDNKCRVEENWSCGPGGCESVCGDAARTGTEQCDDGNLLPGDGCDALCRIEKYFRCERFDKNFTSTTTGPDVCSEICGDGERVQSNLSLVRPGFSRVWACDDGNNVALDGCSPTCEIEVDLGWKCSDDMSALGTNLSARSACRPRCGDGMRTQTETCDDGNLLNRDGCSSSCTVEAGFICNLGTAGAQAQMALRLPANTSCVATLQGNGTCCFANGNAEYGKSCSHTAQAANADTYCLSKSNFCRSSWCEPTVGKSEDICYMTYIGGASLGALMDNMSTISYLERGRPDLCTSKCGDGRRAMNEECDDKNMISGDGCSSGCVIERGWYCLNNPGPGDICNSICGDAVLVEGIEECDDGAWTEPVGDGCTGSCKLEQGFNCSYDGDNRLYGGRCNPVCGDGRWVLGEACDDGNLYDGDGCSTRCLVEDGWVCGQDSSGPSGVCIGICGNGIKVAGEECDDGNIRDQDGCSPSCKIEPGWDCLADGQCSTVCGDGVVFGKESCDDGNQVNGDGCTDDCLIEHGYQCIAANCSGSTCQLQKGGLGSYCEVCPPVRQIAVRCSHPPCPVVGLTADCANWLFNGDGAWISKDDLPASSFEQLCRPAWYGDGFCDAVNNREECQFDLGDCCQGSCECGSARSRACFYGVFGGCGKFKGTKGDYHCIQSQHPETNESLAADLALLRISGGKNVGTSESGPYLSWVNVEITTTRPDLALYFTTDGTAPAEETPTQLLVHGQPYVAAFNLTRHTLLRVSTVTWGFGVGQVSLLIQIKAETPTISPSPVANTPLPSPVVVSIATGTPGATIKYTLTDAMGQSTEYVYTDPFVYDDSQLSVTAWAEKEDLLPSDKTASVSYGLKVSAPVILPSSGRYLRSLNFSVSSDTRMAIVYITICNASFFPGVLNKSVGETYQTIKDFSCYPECKGRCVGGTRDKSVCRDAYDMLTCRGGGQCVETYSPVRTCFPNEWPPDRRVWNSSSRLTIDQDMYGSGARVASYATREGMVDSDVIFEQYFLTTPKPVLYVISDDKNGSQYVQREIEKFQLGGVDPQADSVVRKLFLARPENVFWPHPKNRTLAVPKLSHGQDEGPYPAPLLIYFNFTLGALGGGELRDSIIYYTLNGSDPIPGGNYTFSVPPGQYVVVNSTVNISWVGVTRNLDPSDRQTHSIALQASQPELIALAPYIDKPYIDKASGFENFFFYDWETFISSVSLQGIPVKSALRGLVTEGFAYPGIGKLPMQKKDGTWTYLNEEDKVLFPKSTGSNPVFPLFGMRTASRQASIYYRLLYGGNGTAWPATRVRSGLNEPATHQELLNRGWKVYTGEYTGDRGPDDTLDSPKSKGAIEIRQNVTIEMLAAAPGTTLFPSSIVAYPIYIRVQCPRGHASQDGYSPCALCPQDTFTVCLGDWEVGGQYGPPCICQSCNDTTATIYAPLQDGEATPSILGSRKNTIYSGTVADGAGSADECFPFCRPGAYDARNGVDASLSNCTLCEPGKYAASHRSKECTSCPFGTSTSRSGSKSIAECRGAGGISAGGMHTCGVDINGRAKCWGYDGFNQTAVPKNRLDWQEYGVAYSEMRDDDWFMVAAGSFHSCGITKTLQAKCWGQEFAGKTKVPSLHLPDAPNKAPLKISKWEAITTSAGYHHSCGIADGRAICWGDDEYLQTQIPRTAATATSTAVTASQTRGWSSISAGQFHTCGIDALGTAVCWGDDSYGQSHVPDVNRTYEGPWRNVSAGHYHSCGVTSIGKMHCWGSTLYGATGFPVEVESWANVAVGRYHSCGVTAQGGIRCWGSNQDGAIIVPVEYSASKWRAVTCGLFHTCAITEDRTGVCWGRSVYGLTKVPSAEWASY